MLKVKKRAGNVHKGTFDHERILISLKIKGFQYNASSLNNLSQ